MVWQVATERGAHRGAQLPVKGSQQVVVQDVAVDVHVVHRLGQVTTLPAEDHLRGGVVDADDRGAHFVASTHRFPGARIDVLTRAEGRPQRHGPRVW